MKRRAALFVALALQACANAGPTDEFVEVTDAPTTAPVVILTAQQLDAAPQLTTERVFEVESEADKYPGLTRIGGIGVAGDGTVLILDRLSARLMLFTPDGTFIKSTGGAGDGPGELRNPTHMVVANDTVYITDMHGVNRFTAAGEYIGRAMIKNSIATGGRSSSQAMPQSIAHTSAGVLMTFPNFNPFGGSEDRIIRDTTKVHYIDAGVGTLGPLLMVIESTDLWNIEFGNFPPWLTRERRLAAAGDQLFVSSTSSASVDVFDAEGKAAMRITLQPVRREVTRADVADLQQRLEALLAPRVADGEHAESRRARKSMAAMVRKWKNVPRARYYPVIDRIMPGGAGRVLVERADLSTGEGGWYPIPGPTVWDLIDADGIIHGRVELPSLFTPFLMHDNVIYGTQTDENDIPSIIGLRIIT